MKKFSTFLKRKESEHRSKHNSSNSNNSNGSASLSTSPSHGFVIVEHEDTFPPPSSSSPNSSALEWSEKYEEDFKQYLEKTFKNQTETIEKLMALPPKKKMEILKLKQSQISAQNSILHHLETVMNNIKHPLSTLTLHTQLKELRVVLSNYAEAEEAFINRGGVDFTIKTLSNNLKSLDGAADENNKVLFAEITISVIMILTQICKNNEGLEKFLEYPNSIEEISRALLLHEDKGQRNSIYFLLSSLCFCRDGTYVPQVYESVKNLSKIRGEEQFLTVVQHLREAGNLKSRYIILAFINILMRQAPVQFRRELKQRFISAGVYSEVKKLEKLKVDNKDTEDALKLSNQIEIFNKIISGDLEEDIFDDLREIVEQLESDNEALADGIKDVAEKILEKCKDHLGLNLEWIKDIKTILDGKDSINLLKDRNVSLQKQVDGMTKESASQKDQIEKLKTKIDIMERAPPTVIVKKVAVVKQVGELKSSDSGGNLYGLVSGESSPPPLSVNQNVFSSTAHSDSLVSSTDSQSEMGAIRSPQNTSDLGISKPVPTSHDSIPLPPGMGGFVHQSTSIPPPPFITQTSSVPMPPGLIGSIPPVSSVPPPPVIGFVPPPPTCSSIPPGMGGYVPPPPGSVPMPPGMGGCIPPPPGSSVPPPPCMIGVPPPPVIGFVPPPPGSSVPMPPGMGGIVPPPPGSSVPPPPVIGFVPPPPGSVPMHPGMGGCIPPPPGSSVPPPPGMIGVPPPPGMGGIVPPAGMIGVPPPPGLGGVPVPPGVGMPPPMFGIQSPPVIPSGPKLPDIPKKKSSVPTKDVRLNKLDNNKLQKSVWVKKNLHSKLFEVQIPEKDLEDMFAQISKSPSSGLGSPEKTEKPKDTTISLLEGSRLQNVSIFMKYLKMPSNQLVNKMLTISDEFNEESIGKLLNQVPNEDEIQRQNDFDGDEATLNEADKFIRAIMKVPRLTSRLKCWSFKLKYVETKSCINPDLETIISTCKGITESEKLQDLFAVILAFSNYLSKTGIHGFKLNSLQKLKETKGNTKNVNLLDMIVKHVTSVKPDLLKVREDLNMLERAARVEMQNISEKIDNIEKSITLLKQEIQYYTKNSQEGDRFVEFFSPFLFECEDEMKSIKEKQKDMEIQLMEVAEFLGEDPAAVKKEPKDMFLMLNSFINDFYKSVDNLKKEEEKKKKEESKQAKESSRSSSPVVTVGGLKAMNSFRTPSKIPTISEEKEVSVTPNSPVTPVALPLIPTIVETENTPSTPVQETSITEDHASPVVSSMPKMAEGGLHHPGRRVSHLRKPSILMSLEKSLYEGSALLSPSSGKTRKRGGGMASVDMSELHAAISKNKNN